MKKITSLVLVMLGFSLSAHAALPPLYQSLNEYKALLNDARLAKSMTSAEMIKDIKRTDAGFEIMTNLQTIQVQVIPLPQGQPGPQQFSFKFPSRT
jgi:hypothetical protein